MSHCRRIELAVVDKKSQQGIFLRREEELPDPFCTSPREECFLELFLYFTCSRLFRCWSCAVWSAALWTYIISCKFNLMPCRLDAAKVSISHGSALGQLLYTRIRMVPVLVEDGHFTLSNFIEL